MPMHGGCACGALRYRLSEKPMFVQACHCKDCQRLTGSAFVINIWIEERAVKLVEGKIQSFRLKGGSGRAHDVFFCPLCATAVWSRYHRATGLLFVRAGTLDEPGRVSPMAHIYTRSKLPWVPLPEDVPSFEASYEVKDLWSRERLKRLIAARAQAEGD